MNPMDNYMELNDDALFSSYLHNSYNPSISGSIKTGFGCRNLIPEASFTKVV